MTYRWRHCSRCTGRSSAVARPWIASRRLRRCSTSRSACAEEGSTSICFASTYLTGSFFAAPSRSCVVAWRRHRRTCRRRRGRFSKSLPCLARPYVARPSRSTCSAISCAWWSSKAKKEKENSFRLRSHGCRDDRQGDSRMPKKAADKKCPMQE